MKLFNFVLIVFSFIGIYIGFGLRSDHLAAYGYFVIFMVFSLLFKKNIDKRSWIIASLFLLASLFCLIGDILSNPKIRVLPFIQAFENVLNPFALFLVLSYALNGITETQMKRTVFVFILLVGSMSIFSFFSPDHWLFSFLSSGFYDDESVRNQSIAVGRSLGIFNQPLEAGLFFGSGNFILWHFWLRSNSKYEGLRILILICINFIGGMLSLSKTFYMLSTSLSLVYFLIMGRRMLFLNSIALFCAFVIIFFSLFEGNNYINSLGDLYLEFGLLAMLTAGRFGNIEGTNVVQLFESTTDSSPFFGNGMGTFLPLDNGYLEYYFQGGLMAISPIIVLIAYLFWLSYYDWKTSNGKVLFIFVLFIIFANVGGPVFTANKANVLVAIAVVFFSKPYRHA